MKNKKIKVNCEFDDVPYYFIDESGNLGEKIDLTLEDYIYVKEAIRNFKKAQYLLAIKYEEQRSMKEL